MEKDVQCWRVGCFNWSNPAFFEEVRSQAMCLLSRLDGLGLEQELQRGGEEGSTGGYEDREGKKSTLPRPESGQATSEEGRVPPSLI